MPVKVFPSSDTKCSCCCDLQTLTTQQVNVVAGTTYHFKIGIANGATSTFDSNVWLKANSFAFVGTPKVNCEGSWGAWGSCSVTCGGGTQSSTYTVTLAASNGGTTCPTANGATRTQSCNTQGCPADCVGSWGAWGSCSASCGGGTQSSAYTVTVAAANSGAACEATNGATRSQSCNTQACPVDCVGSWGAWGSCSASCVGGMQTSAYTVTVAAANRGAACEATNGATRTQQCNTQACPVDCVGGWGAWDSCSSSCGGGEQSSTYTVTVAAANGGAVCATANGATRTQSCNRQACPIDCVGSWGPWGSCNATCHGGTQNTTYSVTGAAANGGAACEAADGDIRTQPCNTQPCPGECVGSWGPWDNCSASCGGGTQTSTYSVSLASTNGGAACEAADGDTRTQSCNTQACPTDCVGSWGPWGACNVSCGNGTETSTYSVTVAAANGGMACEAADSDTRTQPCSMPACPSDCVGSWGPWGNCSASCGGGTQMATFSVSSAAANGGAACEATDGDTRTQSCNTQACPVDCVGSWGAWGNCSVSCGCGTQSSTYAVTAAATNGGAACAAADGDTRTQSCNTQSCPVDCVGSWGAYGDCSDSCGGGLQESTYSMSVAAAHGGAACEAADGDTRNQACNTQPCPVDCVGSWGPWGNCSVACHGGTQTSIYSVSQAAANGGADCEAAHGDNRTQPCNMQPCPVDYVGSWGPWSSCSVSCGGGTKTSTYAVSSAATNGGAACAAADGDTRTQACNTQECPVDCVGSWGPWGSCSASCGSGLETSTYSVTAPAAHGGTACEAADGDTRTQPCSTQPCPGDCVGSWGPWGNCSAPCGGGTQTAAYTVTTPASNSGSS
jgi:hypothetical protein